MLLCTPPDNPFQDTDIVYLLIKVPKKPDGFNYCVNEKVQFKVTVLFANLVKKISIHFDENDNKDEREITTNESKNEKLFFEYVYREKGLKEVKFTLIFRQPGKERDTIFNIDIGVKPTIRNDKNLLVGGDIIPGKSLILTAEHVKFRKAEYKWYKDSKLLSGHDERSLIFNPLRGSDKGQYYCTVITDWGKDQSKPSNLIFENDIKAPKIQKQPQSVQATAGKSARFAIRAKGEQTEYQWQKNEEDISGANDTLYEIKDLKIGDDAIYRCIVSNSAGIDTSENVSLKVNKNKIAPKITIQEKVLSRCLVMYPQLHFR